jgi:hypothetical protein
VCPHLASCKARIDLHSQLLRFVAQPPADLAKAADKRQDRSLRLRESESFFPQTLKIRRFKEASSYRLRE